MEPAHPRRRGPASSRAELWEGKTSLRLVRAWLSRGWKARAVQTLTAEYSQGFGRSGGEKAKPGEGTEKIQRKEKEEGDRVDVADLTRLRRGGCTWKIHHLRLGMTEETSTASCPPSLAAERRHAHLLSSYLLVWRRLGSVTCVMKWLCCVSCSLTWPLGDEELLLLSVKKPGPSICRARC